MAAGVYEQLRQRIVSGDIPPGERLTEIALAEEFGISRTPVREALRRLEQDGLAERAARGMRVRERSPNEILEIYEVRILLEGAAARAAAIRRTPLDVARLEQLHEHMVKTEPVDAQAMEAANRRFHEMVWATSHNSTLIDLLTSRLSTSITETSPLTPLVVSKRFWSGVNAICQTRCPTSR